MVTDMENERVDLKEYGKGFFVNLTGGSEESGAAIPCGAVHLCKPVVFECCSVQYQPDLQTDRNREFAVNEVAAGSISIKPKRSEIDR